MSAILLYWQTQQLRRHCLPVIVRGNQSALPGLEQQRYLSIPLEAARVERSNKEHIGVGVHEYVVCDGRGHG